MKSRQRGDRYAANLLSRIPAEDWPSIRAQTLLVSRTMNELYYSVAEDMPLENAIIPQSDRAAYLRLFEQIDPRSP